MSRETQLPSDAKHTAFSAQYVYIEINFEGDPASVGAQPVWKAHHLLYTVYFTHATALTRSTWEETKLYWYTVLYYYVKALIHA